MEHERKNLSDGDAARTDEHETDRLIAYLKKTAETEIKEGEK